MKTAFQVTAGGVTIVEDPRSQYPNPRYHVHSAGCPDLQKIRYRGQHAYHTDLPADKAHTVIYPPGDFNYDPDDAESAEDYSGDMKIFPCAKGK